MTPLVLKHHCDDTHQCGIAGIIPSPFLLFFLAPSNPFRFELDRRLPGWERALAAIGLNGFGLHSERNFCCPSVLCVVAAHRNVDSE